MLALTVIGLYMQHTIRGGFCGSSLAGGPCSQRRLGPRPPKDFSAPIPGQYSLWVSCLFQNISRPTLDGSSRIIVTAMVSFGREHHKKDDKAESCFLSLHGIILKSAIFGRRTA